MRGAPARRTVGVIGGMGPAATVEFLRQLVEATPAACDQDHLHVFVDSDPGIPDRTRSLAGLGPSPLPDLVRIARRLEAIGADLLVMPCNTAHVFAAEIAAAVSIPFVSWIDEAVAHLARLEPRPSTVGVLATTGTIEARIYEDAFAAAGIATLVPSRGEQAEVMEAIHGVKSGEHDPSRAGEILEALVERGADAVVLGCTELPLLGLRSERAPVVDPAAVVAARVVVLAGAARRRVGSAA